MNARMDTEVKRVARSGARDSQRRQGRPLVDPGKKRNQGITVRFSVTELSALRERAAAAGMKIRPYLRELILAGIAGPSVCE